MLLINLRKHSHHRHLHHRAGTTTTQRRRPSTLPLLLQLAADTASPHVQIVEGCYGDGGGGLGAVVVDPLFVVVIKNIIKLCIRKIFPRFKEA